MSKFYYTVRPSELGWEDIVTVKVYPSRFNPFYIGIPRWDYVRGESLEAIGRRLALEIIRDHRKSVEKAKAFSELKGRHELLIDD